MKDYDNLYLKCDVLLLADVLEKVKNNRLMNYGLCPSHYLSAPAFSWNAMRNMKKWNLNLLQILTCTYSLEKVWEVEFVIFLIDILKLTKSVWNLITENKNQNILYT